jgi:hypothetical protein
LKKDDEELKSDQTLSEMGIRDGSVLTLVVGRDGEYRYHHWLNLASLVISYGRTTRLPYLHSQSHRPSGTLPSPK